MFNRRYIGPLFEHKAFYVVVFVCFAVLVGTSFYYCTQITQGIKPKDAVPNDRYMHMIDSFYSTSYIIDYLDVATEHYEEKLAIINVVFCKTDFSRRTIRVSLFLLL